MALSQSDARDYGKQPSAPPAPASSFASVPNESWQLISAFATPPDIYNLSLSSRHFFNGYWPDVGIAANDEKMPAAAAADGEEEISPVLLSTKRASKRAKTTAAPANDDNTDESSILLATHLLRTSLLSSLRRVLDHSQSGITLDAVLSLGDLNLPDGSALIAGSTMAQACLGVLWEGRYGRPDVDVFTSAKAAPQVRSWLVEKAGCMFTGFNDGYIEITSDKLAYTVDTKIHHVEGWGSIAQNYVSEEIGGEYDYGDKMVEKAKEFDLETLKKTDYYKTRAGYGKNCQKNYVDWKWKNTMSFDVLQVDKNSKYNIKPKLRKDLPFDFNGSGDIDLVVARVGKRGEENSSFDLLDDFDLEICKASFDGKTLRIPDPHRIFNRKSAMEPNRRAVVASYVNHFRAPADRWDPVATSQAVNAAITAVRADVPNAPFFKHVDFAAKLPDRYDPDSFWGPGSLQDPMVEAKLGSPLLFHNWTRKLINRLQKYQARGIEVVGAPAIANDYSIDAFNLRSHGG